MNIQIFHLFFVLFLCYSVPGCNSVPAEKDLTLTKAEKTALDKLKPAAEKIVPHDYMKREAYLIRWVRAAHLDVNEAFNKIKNHLQWREDNQVDKLLNEDYSEFNETYPIYEAEDYGLRPVIIGLAGEWDVRLGVLTQRAEKAERFVYREVEWAAKKVRDKQDRGELVTRFQVIFDLKGFNIQQHACLRCVASYVRILRAFQEQYPLLADHIIVLNTPGFFFPVLETLRTFARNDVLRGTFKLFGTNKEEWKKYLLKIIPPEQLLDVLGGTRVTEPIGTGDFNRRKRWNH